MTEPFRRALAAFGLLAAAVVSPGSFAQDSKAWLEAQGLEAVDTKSFQDWEAVVARAKGATEEKLVVFAKGKPAWQSSPKEIEGAARFQLRAIGTDLDGDGNPDLHFTTTTGGARCCTTHYAYRLKPQVKRLAVFPANGVGGADFLPVAQRKTPILITADDVSGTGAAPSASDYFPAVILEVSPKGRFQFAQDLMHAKLPGQPPPVCTVPEAVANPWLKERCGEYASARRTARVAEIKAKLAGIKQGRAADQLKWDDYYATGVLAAVAAELNRYAYTGHALAGFNWLETVWPGNDAVKLKVVANLRTAWGKSVFAEDLKALAADSR
jgi:hypothetical protein